MAMRPQTEFVYRYPERSYPIEARVDADGKVTVDGLAYGSLMRDVKRPMRREWVLTHADGHETEHLTKGDALFHASKVAPLDDKPGHLR